MSYTQWSEHDGTYMPVGNTLPKIDPGYYDLTVDQRGQLYYVPVRPRTDDLLRFPDSAALLVLNHISEFWNREATFKKYGVPFKRGIFLSGPPGSGKTSVAQLVARDVVERGGIVLTFPDDSALFLSAYRALRDIQPDTPVVVLMEDFESTLKRVNESKLLNLLDGVEELSRVCFLATSNYPEQMESRIINRPSRFDVVIKIGHPKDAARRMYLESLIHDGDALDIAQYVKDTQGMSLAHVKELFVATHIMGADYAGTVERLNAMRDKPLSSKNDDDDEYDMISSWFGIGTSDQKAVARTVGAYL